MNEPESNYEADLEDALGEEAPTEKELMDSLMNDETALSEASLPEGMQEPKVTIEVEDLAPEEKENSYIVVPNYHDVVVESPLIEKKCVGVDPISGEKVYI